MPGLTLSAADAVLKEFYEGPLRKQINDEVKFVTQVTKDKVNFVGRRAIIPCHMTRNTGIGSRLENEQIPVAGNQGTVDQIVATKAHYGRYRLTRQVISRMDGERGSFIRAASLEADGLKTDTAREYNRQAWGTSDGAIATCGVTALGATVIVLASSTPEQTLVNLAEGMRIDIGTTANPQSIVANRGISAVDFTNKTITITGGGIPSATSASNFIFRQGSGGTGANQREITGVPTMVSSSGALFGIDPATYWQWASITESNSGTLRPISENLVARAMHRSMNRSGKPVTQLWAEDGVYRAAANVLAAQKRIVNSLDLSGGNKGLEFSAGGDSVALMRDRDAPTNVIFGLAVSEFTEYVNEDWQFENLDGSVMRLATDGSHAFEAIWFKFSELATHRRNAHFLISDLDVA